MKRRTYSVAAAVPGAEGVAVALDGTALRTPGGRPVLFPSGALARAVALEWASQGDRIAPETMPLTRLGNAAIDTVAANRAAVLETVAGYAATDLVCYRAPGPEDLRRRQDAAWDPLLDWLARTHGARLAVTFGLTAAVQPPAARGAVRRALERADAFSLTALHAMTSTLGSVVIGLALAAGRLDRDTAFRTALIEELYQVERWGDDPQAEARRLCLRDDLEAADRFLLLCR